MNKVVKDALKAARHEQGQKLGLYLTPHAIMGYHDIVHYYILGSRGRGKSVFSMEAVINAKNKYGWENVKCFYFRVSDLSVKALLANKAKNAVDPILVSKYNMDITCKCGTVYDHGRELFQAFALVSAAKVGKGVALYDANFLNKRPLGKDGKPIKRFVFVIIDEFLMADGLEKKSVGNPYDQWKVYAETIMRDQEKLNYDAVRCFYLANSVSECANWMGRALNYIPSPNDFGIKKLKRKHAVVWNVPNSEAYIEKRKKSVFADLMDFENDPNYTNTIIRDIDSIKPKKTRIRKVTQLIMFSKSPADWFCLYDGKYIRQYRNETVSKNIKVSMVRHLNEMFYPEMVKEIFTIYDAKAFMYTDIMSQAAFCAKMKELKNK